MGLTNDDFKSDDFVVEWMLVVSMVILGIFNVLIGFISGGIVWADDTFVVLSLLPGMGNVLIGLMSGIFSSVGVVPTPSLLTFLFSYRATSSVAVDMSQMSS